MVDSLHINQNIENNKNDEFVYFQKINIFGEAGVGKTSLISYMEKYDFSDFVINPESERRNSDDSYNFSLSIVEQIKQIKIDFNEEKNLYFNIYETDLNRYDAIKMNLDTLLFRTECIIIIWDKNNPETFENIPSFVSTIESGIKQNKFREMPIFVIQNKSDLDLDISNLSKGEDEFMESIEKFKREYPNIVYKELSLLDKNQFYYLIKDIDEKMCELKKDNYISKVKFKDPLKNVIIDNNNNYNAINCSLLGNFSVGKSSFLNSILKGNNGDKLSFLAKIDDEIIYLNLYDTAGQEKYGSIPLAHFKNSDGILLFFDTTNENSFNQIDNWIKEIELTIGKINIFYELFLIGNKIDENDKRQVQKSKVKELANKYNIRYYEISCLKGINIYELFTEITLMAYESYKRNNKEENKTLTISKKNVIKKKKKKCC